MGWKNVKEHFDIKHYVQITSAGLCIGSGYIHDIIVVGLDGVITKHYDSRSNDDLQRYQTALSASPEKVAELLKAPDHFDRAIPVYTYDGATIIEKRCEEAGWPNPTHDGQMMYNNTFFLDRADAVQKAKSETAAAIAMTSDHRVRLLEQLAECEARLAQRQADAAQLAAEYPETPAVNP